MAFSSAAPVLSSGGKDFALDDIDVFLVGTTTNPPIAAPLLNISTRLQVLTDDQVLIGGFIVTGTQPKTVILRAIGPYLGAFGIAGPLADPIMELRAGDGTAGRGAGRSHAHVPSARAGCAGAAQLLGRPAAATQRQLLGTRRQRQPG